MAATPDPTARGSRAWMVVAMLLLALVLTGVLAYQALDAARSHRRAAESALHDYAAFAAWQFGRTAEAHLYDVLHRPLHPIAHSDWAPEAMPRPRNDSDTLTCGCAQSPVRPRSYFRLDLGPDVAGDAALAITGEMPAAAVRTWVRDTVALHARRVQTDRPLAFIAGAVDGEPRLIVYDIQGDDRDAAYGYIAGVAGLGPATQHVARNADLLPPSLLADAPDSLFSIRVALGGQDVFRTPASYSTEYVAADTLDRLSGDLVARVGLDPETASQLVIGGLPGSKLPLLLGLLALVGGLVFVALRQLRRQYELARLRSDFISGVSHELRTPLAQVRMFAETLLLGRVRSDGERRRALAIINQEATRLTSLVDNVLHFSRAERDASRVDPEPVALAPEVREVIEGFAPVADSHDVTLRTELDEDAVAPADREALRQILLNLLDNAAKYGPDGQTVTVELTEADGDARIRVVDEGPGVPPEARDRIFAAYQRLERDVESAVGGSGIGLSVVRELTELHGGSVDVGTAPDGGAAFVVTLPDARRRPPAPVQSEEPDDAEEPDGAADPVEAVA